MTKNRINYVLNIKPSQLIQLNEVWDEKQQGLGLETNYFPLNVLHLFVIKPDAVQFIRKCVPSYSEGHTLLSKVHTMHKTTLLFKHYTRLPLPPVKYKKLDCAAIFILSETSNNPFWFITIHITQSGTETVYESLSYFIRTGAFSNSVILVLLFLLANTSVSG